MLWISWLGKNTKSEKLEIALKFYFNKQCNIQLDKYLLELV